MKWQKSTVRTENFLSLWLHTLALIVLNNINSWKTAITNIQIFISFNMSINAAASTSNKKFYICIVLRITFYCNTNIQNIPESQVTCFVTYKTNKDQVKIKCIHTANINLLSNILSILHLILKYIPILMQHEQCISKRHSCTLGVHTYKETSKIIPLLINKFTWWFKY
jgi:hypothetical protein